MTRIRIETYPSGPTEVRIRNLNSSGGLDPSPKPLTDKPGAAVPVATECSAPGFISLGQAAFRTLAMASKARKQNTQE